MEILTDRAEVDAIVKNTVVNPPKMQNSKIAFKGSNNILYCAEGKLVLDGCDITFEGDDSVIFLSESRHAYKLNISVYHDSVIYFGRNNYINGTLHMIASERQHIIVGDEGLFSFDCWFRTADPHLIYDIESHSRINMSKSILIGDHVWLGQNVLILKGSRIGSGSIIAAGAIVTGKKLASNCVYGGNPAGLIRSGVFYSGASVHAYRKSDTKKSRSNTGDEWIYGAEESEPIKLGDITAALRAADTSKGRLEYLLQNLYQKGNKEKDRFFIRQVSESSGIRQRMRQILHNMHKRKK
jgi:acetyltransferase-like isoleucine patch superfamily enzyme